MEQFRTVRLKMPNTPCKGKSIIHNESVTLLPLQGVGIHAIITQGVALGYEFFGLSARFNRTVRFFFDS